MNSFSSASSIDLTSGRGDETTSFLKSGWIRLSHLGIEAEDNHYLQRKIELTNQVSFIILIVVFALLVGFWFSEVPSATINWFVALLTGVGIIPFFNHLRYRNLARHMLSTILPLFSIIFVGHIRAVFPESVHEASFYIPRFYQIALSFIPLFVFGFEEKRHLLFSFSINVLLLLGYNEIMEVMGAGIGTAEANIADPFFVSISSVLALVVVSTGYFFLNKKNSEYELKIEGLLDQTETQNRQMQDAVNYAKYIQQVVLPKPAVLKALSSQLFVMHKPLHTVSGDFYLIEENETHLLLSVIDCTGHGVPGAFMSILANSAIQRAIALVGLDHPEEVMDHTNRLFHKDLQRSGNPDMRDGMEMAICSVEKSTGKVKVAGANHKVFVVSKNELVEYTTDKGGISTDKPNRTFSCLDLNLDKGDLIYLSSDGFPDQFGGEQGKRLGKRKFKQVLESMANDSLTEQRLSLKLFFEEWMAGETQVDDVCVMGIKV